MRLRILAAILAIATIGACSQPPTAPGTPETPGMPSTPQATAFEGVWAIKYTVEDCSGFRQCVHYRGDSRTFVLRLAAVANGYEGVVDLGDHVSVSGSVDANGRLILTGRREAALADDFEIEVDALTLENPGWTPSGTPGTVRYTTRGPSNGNFNGRATTFGPITAVERTAALDGSSSYSGYWTGQIPVRSCEAIGWTRCYPLWDETTNRFSLSLVPGAGGVAGTLNAGTATIPVAGAGSGSRLALAGSVTSVSGGATTTYSVEANNLVVDRVGRLTGDITIVATWNWNDGRGTWSVRYPPLPLHSVARSSQ